MKTFARFGSTGRRRGVEPVAMTKPSKPTASPVSRVTARAATSSAVARAPRRQSSASSSQPSLRSAISAGSSFPASSPLESGGRSYGRWCSAEIATMRPSYSPRRSDSAARRPASDIPAMTIVFGTIVPSATSATLPVCARAPPGRWARGRVEATQVARLWLAPNLTQTSYWRTVARPERGAVPCPKTARPTSTSRGGRCTYATSTSTASCIRRRSP